MDSWTTLPTTQASVGDGWEMVSSPGDGGGRCAVFFSVMDFGLNNAAWLEFNSPDLTPSDAAQVQLSISE